MSEENLSNETQFGSSRSSPTKLNEIKDAVENLGVQFINLGGKIDHGFITIGIKIDHLNDSIQDLCNQLRNFMPHNNNN
jgi:hypothetical protein